jgi:hypothetical protein
VRSFLWLALAERGRLGRVLAFARFTVPLSACVLCDRLSRRLFNRFDAHEEWTSSAQEE